MRYLIVLLALMLSSSVNAGEVGVRFNNLVNEGGLFNLDFTGAGKLFEGKYTDTPLSGRFKDNFFAEGAVGRYFTADFNSPSFWVAEASPGVKVEVAGVVRLSLSQGMAFFNSPGSYLQFVTHVSVVLMDNQSGISVGLERSHYSSGDSGAGAGYELTGFAISWHI